MTSPTRLPGWLASAKIEKSWLLCQQASASNVACCLPSRAANWTWVALLFTTGKSAGQDISLIWGTLLPCR